MLLSCMECDNCTGAGTFVLGAAAWGAGIGAIIEACILTPRDVYRAGGRHVDVRPVVTSTARGATLSLRW